MTDLRDVRLKKALDSAPDGDARPTDEVREAILNKARLSAASAVKPKPVRASWWNFSRPWNSGLATVGLVAFVGVLVWNQDLLKQAQKAPEAARPEVSAPQAAVTGSKLKPEPAPERQQRDLALEQERRAQAERAQSMARQKSSAAADKALAPPPPVMVRIQPTPQLSVPMPEVAIRQESYAAPAPKPAAPPPPPAPAMAAPPAPAPVFAPMPVEVPHPVAARASVVAAPTWTALRIATPEGPQLLTRESLPLSTQVLLDQQLRASADGKLRADAAVAPGLQIEVMAGEHSVSHLDLGPGELREQLEAAMTSLRGK